MAEASDVPHQARLESLDVLRSRSTAIAIALSLCFLFSVAAFSQPYYDWDMLAYLGIIQERAHSEPEAIHAATWDAVRAGVDDKTFWELTHSHNRYRETAYEDPISFAQQLDWYRMRVGYWGIGYALSEMGMSPIVALRVVGATAYFGLLVTVFLYFWHFFPGRVWPVVVALMIGLHPSVFLVSRTITPDMLAGLGIALGFSFLMRAKLVLGALVLFAAVFARTDAGIACLVVAGPVLLVGEGSRSQRILATAILVAAVPLAMGLNTAFEHPGWAKLFTDDFKGKLTHPATAAVAVSAGDYLKVLVTWGVKVVKTDTAWLTLALGVVGIWKLVADDRWREPLALWLAVTLLYIPAWIVAFPNPQDRYFIAAPLMVLMVLVRLFAPRSEPRAARVE